MKWLTTIAAMAAGGLAVASFSPTSRPSILSTLDKPGQIIMIILVFGVFAYFWYAFHLSMARAKRTNIHYVSRDVVKRLDAQARGEDPPAICDTPATNNKNWVTSRKATQSE